MLTLPTPLSGAEKKNDDDDDTHISMNLYHRLKLLYLLSTCAICFIILMESYVKLKNVKMVGLMNQNDRFYHLLYVLKTANTSIFETSSSIQ